MPASFCDIDEIIRVICQYCDKPTLASLARTNKCFSDPALDVLWETLDSFSNLIRLLPSDLVTWRTHEYGPDKPLVNHLIVPRDWVRFSLYAPRVRTWSQEDLSYIDEPIVDHVAFGRNPGYILPRLTHMEVSATCVSGVHLQTLILCPTLQSVTVWNPEPLAGPTRAMHTFFRTLADRSPALKKLVVHWDREGDAAQIFRDGLVDVYSTVAGLQSVHLWSPGCITPRSFALLAQLPLLGTLHLNLIGVRDADDLCSEVPAREGEPTFPALQNVFLAGDLQEFTKVLRCFRGEQVTSLGFSVRQYPHAKALRTLFQTVAAHFCGSLRILQFNVPKDEIDSIALSLLASAPELCVHDFSVLRPLLDMRGLVAVHVELGVPLHLNDADLLMIGTAWSKIEVLNLSSDPYCDRTRGVRPTATVRGLFSLIGRCTRLHHLGLYLDYSCFVDADLVGNCSAVSGSVETFDVGRSWITHPAYVAALLSGTFPGLKQFQWAGMADASSVWREYSGHSASWKQVFELLPIFRATRAHERRTQSLSHIAMNVD